ncbi:hypothetical protein KUU58_32265, partial [Pseudomonas aeruginosa]|nr:hypothetical protein [Pseudomonas aeruginosa]
HLLHGKTRRGEVGGFCQIRKSFSDLPFVSVLIEKFSSASFRRRPAGGEWARPRPEHPHRAGGDMYFQVRLDKGNCHEWIRRKQKRIKTLKNRILPGSIVDW